MTIEELYAHFRRHPQVTTDSRRCPKGGIFFALKGDNFNGNAYAQKALDAGCSLAIVDEAQYATSPQTILVDDALATLQALAHHHRQQLQEKFFLQITGTNGKTTTKELVAAVLSRSGDVQYTQGNLNNHIGVPLTILSLQPGPGYAIIETGANHPGEIQQLTNIVDPDWGLVTNVGRAHLEGFGSYEGVCRTKGELYDYLRQHNKIGIFLNKSAERLTEMAHALPAVTYGLTPAQGADVPGEVIECNPFVRFRYRQDGRPWQTVQTRLIGDYNIHNLMAAVCVGIEFMVPYSEINDALATDEPHLTRSE